MPEMASRRPNLRKVKKSLLLRWISPRHERELCAKRVLAGEELRTSAAIVAGVWTDIAQAVCIPVAADSSDGALAGGFLAIMSNGHAGGYAGWTRAKKHSP
jgi:hypothetical protein